MNINLAKLDYPFVKKPLLIGGMAKEYYGVRKAGDDIDFVISREDFQALAEKYPNNIKDLEKDLGIVLDDLELWRSISWFGYDYLSKDAIELKDCLVISIEKLIFLTALTMDKEKYLKDLQLLVKKIIEDQYKKGPPKP